MFARRSTRSKNTSRHYLSLSGRFAQLAKRAEQLTQQFNNEQNNYQNHFNDLAQGFIKLTNQLVKQNTHLKPHEHDDLCAQLYQLLRGFISGPCTPFAPYMSAMLSGSLAQNGPAGQKERFKSLQYHALRVFLCNESLCLRAPTQSLKQAFITRMKHRLNALKQLKKACEEKSRKPDESLFLSRYQKKLQEECEHYLKQDLQLKYHLRILAVYNRLLMQNLDDEKNKAFFQATLKKLADKLILALSNDAFAIHERYRLIQQSIELLNSPLLETTSWATKAQLELIKATVTHLENEITTQPELSFIKRMKINAQQLKLLQPTLLASSHWHLSNFERIKARAIEDVLFASIDGQAHDAPKKLNELVGPKDTTQSIHYLRLELLGLVIRTQSYVKYRWFGGGKHVSYKLNGKTKSLTLTAHAANIFTLLKEKEQSCEELIATIRKELSFIQSHKCPCKRSSTTQMIYADIFHRLGLAQNKLNSTSTSLSSRNSSEYSMITP